MAETICFNTIDFCESFGLAHTLKATYYLQSNKRRRRSPKKLDKFDKAAFHIKARVGQGPTDSCKRV